VRPASDDLAALEHDHLVGQRDRRQPVRDHERGAAPHHLGERRLDLALGRGVHARGRVVEDQDARLGKQRAGDGHALALPARQREPPLADERVEPLRELVEQLRETGALGRASHLLVGRLRPRVGDVVAQACGEQERVVRHHRHLTAQRGGVEVAHVHAVHEHRALVHVVQPRDQHDQRRLAGSGGADQGHRAARLDVQVHVAYHRLLAGIAEGGVPDLHPPASRWHRLRVRRRHEPGRPVEQLEHSRAARHRPLRHAQRHPEPAHRAGQQQHVAVEGDELADRDPAVDHLAAAHEQQRREPELGEEADERRVEGPQPRGHHRLVEDARDRLAEPP
jgi:hypothetical protein